MRVSLYFATLMTLATSPVQAQNRMCAGERAAMAASAGMDVEKAARDLAESQEDAAATAQQRAAYQENLRIRRQQAEQYAAAARSVPLPPDAPTTLRNELAADIEQWRAEFGVGHKQAEEMRREWLVDRDSLSALQWAQRRVDWWAARDAWIAHNRS